MQNAYIQQVKFADYQAEITAMMMTMCHLEPQPVNIPVARYRELDEMGVLKVYLWKAGKNIKGVALLFVSPSLRNPTVLDASTDVLWVKPEYRGNSRDFINGLKTALQLLGVDYWLVSSRDSHPITTFLENNHFSPLERVYFCQLSEV